MTTRKYTEQDKEEAFTLYSQNWSYGDIVKAMNKRYNHKMAKSTISRWARDGGWEERREKVAKQVQKVTQQSATDTITRAITMGRGIQSMFVKQLKEGMEIRPADVYAWTQLMLKLETAMDAREVLIDEVAQLSAEAMDKAGIPKQKQAAFAQHYTQLVRDLKGKSDD